MWSILLNIQTLLKINESTELRSHAHVKDGEHFGMQSTLPTISKAQSTEKLSKGEENHRLLVLLHILSNSDLHPEHQWYHVKVSVIFQSWSNLSNSLLREIPLMCRKDQGLAIPYVFIYKHQRIHSDEEAYKNNQCRKFSTWSSHYNYLQELYTAETLYT